MIKYFLIAFTWDDKSLDKVTILGRKEKSVIKYVLEESICNQKQLDGIKGIDDILCLIHGIGQYHHPSYQIIYLCHLSLLKIILNDHCHIDDQ